MHCPSIFIALVLAASPARQSQTDTVQGAVRSLDTRARTLEVKTGTGHVLRVVRLQVPPETRVSAAGDSLSFAALKPADIVRVTFGSRGGAPVAYTVDRVGRMESMPQVKP